MQILRNITFQYTTHIVGKRKCLVPLLFKIHDFEKHYFISLQSKLKKNHLFNKSNKKSKHILHYHTLLEVVHSIVRRNNLLSLILKKS